MITYEFLNEVGYFAESHGYTIRKLEANGKIKSGSIDAYSVSLELIIPTNPESIYNDEYLLDKYQKDQEESAQFKNI